MDSAKVITITAIGLLVAVELSNSNQSSSREDGPDSVGGTGGGSILKHSKAEEGKSWECVVDVPGLHRRTFQDWVVRQPIKLGGLGMRSQADLSPAAFMGALEPTLPSFIGERGICPQLSQLERG